MVLLRRPFGSGVKNRLQKRKVNPVSREVRATGKISGIVPAASDRGAGGLPNVALNSFEVRLGGLFDTGPLGYLLRVRREDVLRLFLGRSRESDVAESAFLTPGDKVMSSSESSFLVLVSRFSPVCGPDTSQCRCDSSPNGSRYACRGFNSGQRVFAEDQVGNWSGRERASAASLSTPAMCSDWTVKVEGAENVRRAA